MIQIAARIDKGAAGFGHLLAVDRHKTVNADFSRGAVLSTAQHGWPEQRVEVDDILADKMVQLGLGVFIPVVIKIHALTVAKIFKAGHIAYWCIQPDIEVLARGTGEFKTKVGCIAADIPFLQSAVQPLAKFVGDFRLHCATARPIFQELGKLGQLKEVVGRLFLDGGGPGDCRYWIDQVGG